MYIHVDVSYDNQTNFLFAWNELSLHNNVNMYSEQTRPDGQFGLYK